MNVQVFPRPPKDTRIKFLATSDPHTSLPPGTLGRVQLVDDFGTIHVKWDNGSTLGMIPGEDSYSFVDDEGNDPPLSVRKPSVDDLSVSIIFFTSQLKDQDLNDEQYEAFKRIEEAIDRLATEIEES